MVYQDGEACVSDDGSTTRSVAPPWVAQVLDFWFREVGEEFWFTASSDVNSEFADVFLGCTSGSLRGTPAGWPARARYLRG